MKSLSITTYLLIYYCIASAQIITPGFINYTKCPDYYSQVMLCPGWYQPTGGTSDYFNACATGILVGVPGNLLGYQNTADNAYAGLLTYAPAAFVDYKEYIGTSIAPLIVGRTYTMSVTVSLADSSNYATDGLGVLFSTYRLSLPSQYSTLLIKPQVDYSSYGPITNKTDWVTLTETFVADSAYTNLTVGCFKPVDMLKLEHVDGGATTGINGNAPESVSYYYISRIGMPDSTNQSLDGVTEYVYPGAFSPNKDGRNDEFHMIRSNTHRFSAYSLSIFNRWGQLVFFSNNAAKGWDGTFNNIPQEIGTYFYRAKLTEDDKDVLLKGDVTLIR